MIIVALNKNLIMAWWLKYGRQFDSKSCLFQFIHESQLDMCVQTFLGCVLMGEVGHEVMVTFDHKMNISA